jgi:Ribbon-helix-helix protein, copG family
MLISKELGIGSGCSSVANYETIMSSAMKNFTFRVPQETYDRLLEAVKLTGRTRSSIVREAWERRMAEWPELKDSDTFHSVEGPDASSART